MQKPNQWGRYVRQGRLSLGYPSGGDPDIERVRITMRDDSSGVEFIAIEVPMEEFARALSCRADRPVRYELLADLSRVGKRREQKTVHIVFPPNSLGGGRDGDADVVREAFAEHEVDGWKGRENDATNHHNHVYRKDGTVVARVLFERFVDLEGESDGS